MIRRAFLLCILCLAFVGFTRAEPPKQKDEAPAVPGGRHDQQGDPLHEGAIARLGTTRWRVSGHVRGLSFSPDGKTVASASFDDTVRLWDVNSGKEIRRHVERADGTTICVAFSPDGKMLASAGADKVIRLTDPATGKLMRTLEGHTQQVSRLSFSSNGDSLVSDGGDAMRLWEVSSGKELRVDRSRNRGPSAFTRDGKHIVHPAWHSDVPNFGFDYGLWLWDIASGKNVKPFHADNWPLGKPYAIASLAVSSDGKLVAAGGNSSNPDVFVWELASGKQVYQFRGHEGRVNDLAFSPDGKYLVSGHDPGTTTARSGASVILWDLQTGKEVKRLAEPSMRVFSLAFSPNGRLLAVGTTHSIRVWDLVENKEHRPYPGHHREIESIAVSPDGKTACTFSHDGAVRLWDARTGAERRLLMYSEDYPRAVAFAARGKQVVVVASSASGVREVYARVWELATGKEMGQVPVGDDSHFFAIDDRRIASLSLDGVMLKTSLNGSSWIWWGTTGPGNSALALLPGGKSIVVSEDNGGKRVIQVRDTTSGKTLHESPQPTDWPVFDYTGLGLRGITPGGRKMLLWQKCDWQERDIRRRSKSTESMKTDEKKGNREEIGRLWVVDTSTGKAGPRISVKDLQGPFAALSPDGTCIAAGVRGGLIRIFDAKTGKERATFKGDQGLVTTFAFSSDSKTLFSGSDTTVLVWDVSRIPFSDPDPDLSDPVLPKGLWRWIVGAVLLLLALVGLWKLLSFFGRQPRSA